MEKALKQFSSQMSIITTFISFIAAISFIAGIGGNEHDVYFSF